MAIWDALGSVGGGIVGAIAQGIQAKKERSHAKEMADLTLRQNKELAEYQYSKDLDMWNRANAYNSPQAQMDRLRAGGLNPNLVYGHGAVATSSAQLPKYNAPQADFSGVPSGMNLPGMVSAFQDLMIRQAQYDNLNAQRKNTEADLALKQIAGRVKGGPEMEGWQRGSIRAKSLEQYIKNLLMGGTLREGGGWEWDPNRPRAYQAQMLQEGVRKRRAEVDATFARTRAADASTELLRKQSEWFLWKLFGGMASNLGRDILKMTPMGRGARFGGAGSKAPVPARNKVGRISSEWLRKNGYLD